MKIGDTVYTVEQPKYIHVQLARGLCSYQRATLSIALNYNTGTKRPIKPAQRRATFWHEVTHAILHDMGDRRHKDEGFVNAFATRLSAAIDSAEFA
jgi:hypothetical protein